MDTTFTQGYALVVGVGGNLPNTVNDARGVASLYRPYALRISSRSRLSARRRVGNTHLDSFRAGCPCWIHECSINGHVLFFGARM